MSLTLEPHDVVLDDVSWRIGLIRLESEDSSGPFLLDHVSLADLQALCAEIQAWPDADLDMLVLRGTDRLFCAGANLNQAQDITSPLAARAFAQAGHDALQAINSLPIPTVAWLTGSAIGGGLELALHCDIRVAEDKPGTSFSLPEVRLGLIPGWGGAHLLPQLTGMPRALELMVQHALAGSRGWSVQQSYEHQLVDSLIPESSELDLVVAAALESLGAPGWNSLTSRFTGKVAQHDWHKELAAVRHRAEIIETSTPALLELVEHLEVVYAGPASGAALDTIARADQVDRLARLIPGPQFRRARYAMDATARIRPAKGAQAKVRQLGVVGAGLMAAQIAAIAVDKLRIPVLMIDLDQERVDAGIEHVHGIWQRQDQQRGKVFNADERGSLLSGTTDIADFHECDVVIEAIPEVLDLKKSLFAQLEEIVSPEAVLASNTSALSLTQMASGLQYPGRVVGIHFFNPVAKMPLVEIVRQELSSEECVNLARDFAYALGKSAVACMDRPGFIVNRLLLLMLGRILKACDDGTPLEVANRALDRLGLPMRPFELLDLVGPGVAQHVLETLHTELGPRFPTSAGLAAITNAGIRLIVTEPTTRATQINPEVQQVFSQVNAAGASADEIYEEVVTHLAAEVKLMLDDGAALRTSDLDAAIILGAGWPWALGGLTPFLIDNGYSA